MRLWSIHPRYLDRAGLTACWREALLAQKVLRGQTTGYKNHPQLIRFQEATDPLAAIGLFLRSLAEEASRRDYSFDSSKIYRLTPHPILLSVTTGQLAYEFAWLQEKLRARDHTIYLSNQNEHDIHPHPMFRPIMGDVEYWERPHEYVVTAP